MDSAETATQGSRVIKVRAWDKEFHHMSYPTVLILDTGGDGSKLTSYQHEMVSLLDKTTVVMQFTGLKDKNGKEIYEGDIVRRWFMGTFEEEEKIRETGEVYWDNKIGWTLDGAWNIGIYATEDFDQLEIIGNIYENPDLLKEAA